MEMRGASLVIIIGLLANCAEQPCDELISKYEKEWEGKSITEPKWSALPERCLEEKR